MPSKDVACARCSRKYKDAPLGGKLLPWQKCPNCGRYYCGHCGRDLDKRDIMPPRRGYCPECGEGMVWLEN